jgi:cell fate regulator YaaT (PSP1 superfamily)
MGCGSCSTGSCSTGGCGGGCKSGGCNKLNTHDWFSGMQQPTASESDNVYEVRFKNTRKEFFKNANSIPLITGDYVVVESDRGFDVGQISLGGILARLQMRKRKVRNDPSQVKKIYRRASKEDVEKLFKAREREHETLLRTREIIRELDLDMKLSDVEYQGDNTKAIYYYIADTRVDFRELIKRLANEFRVRVEMKQIGLRHESGLIGGIGSCGRELCCTTWLTDFKTVSTAAARYQNLSLNPMKISGQCGRLKCCLNFELDAYMDALKDIPKVERLETEHGVAYLQKTDIFKRIMWFSFAGDTTWIAVNSDKVRQLHELNLSGIKPATLQALDAPVVIDELDRPMDFVDVVGQSVLREDPKRKKKKKKPGAQNPRTGRPEGQAQQERRPDGQGRQGRPDRRNDARGPRPERRNEGENRPSAERGPRQDRRQEGGQERPPREPRPEGQPEDAKRDQSKTRGGGRNRGNRGGGPEGQAGPRPEGQAQREGRDQNRRNQDGRNNQRGGGKPRGEGPPPKDQGSSNNPPA